MVFAERTEREKRRNDWKYVNPINPIIHEKGKLGSRRLRHEHSLSGWADSERITATWRASIFLFLISPSDLENRERWARMDELRPSQPRKENRLWIDSQWTRTPLTPPYGFKPNHPGDTHSSTWPNSEGKRLEITRRRIGSQDQDLLRRKEWVTEVKAEVAKNKFHRKWKTHGPVSVRTPR